MDCYAFTTKSDKITSRIITEAKIVSNEKMYHSMLAQWDTGATNTCISKRVVEELGLIPIGIEQIHTPSGEDWVNSYLVDIILRNNVTVKSIKVNDSAIGGQGIDMLIGMDIIRYGDLSITNVNNKTVFSFRIPSIQAVDYVEEINSQQKQVF